eukprot:1137567-Pelagomonas_calceolata.AAC.2
MGLMELIVLTRAQAALCIHRRAALADADCIGHELPPQCVPAYDYPQGLEGEWAYEYPHI